MWRHRENRQAKKKPPKTSTLLTFWSQSAFQPPGLWGNALVLFKHPPPPPPPPWCFVMAALVKYYKYTYTMRRPQPQMLRIWKLHIHIRSSLERNTISRWVMGWLSSAVRRECWLDALATWMLSALCVSASSFTQWTFSKFLLCTRHWTRYRKYKNDWDKSLFSRN